MGLSTKGNSALVQYIIVGVDMLQTVQSLMYNLSLPDRLYAYNSQLMHLTDFNCVSFFAPEVV